MATKYTIAFAGSGESSPENIKALLNDFLGFGPEDEEGYPEVPEDLDVEILLPSSDSHVTGSIMDVFDWTEYADLGYTLITPAKVKETKNTRLLDKYADKEQMIGNVNEAIIDNLVDAGKRDREAYLFLFWGEQGDENSENLLDLATSLDVKVKDVTAGLDDISFETEDSANASDPEPEPEPEKPKRGRRRATVPEPEPEKTTPEPEKPARRRRTTKAEEPAEAAPAVTEPVVDQTTPEPVGNVGAAKTRLVLLDDAYARYQQAIENHLPHSREKGLAVTNAEQAHLWVASCLGKHVGGLEDPKPLEAPEKPSRGRGRPRNDGADPAPRSAKDKARVEIWDEDTEEWVRKGRGRVPKGAKTRLVDPKTGEEVTDE